MGSRGGRTQSWNTSEDTTHSSTQTSRQTPDQSIHCTTDDRTKGTCNAVQNPGTSITGSDKRSCDSIQGVSNIAGRASEVRTSEAGEWSNKGAEERDCERGRCCDAQKDELDLAEQHLVFGWLKSTEREE